MGKQRSKCIAPYFFLCFLLTYAYGLGKCIHTLNRELANLQPLTPQWVWRLLVCLGPLVAVGALFCATVLIPYLKQTRRLRRVLATDSLLGALDAEYYFSREMRDTLCRLKKQLEVEDTKSQSKWAEYLTLQNQINPHFLYNTLESIRGDALEKGAEQIAEITEALAAFFRYTISQNNVLVPLEDELSNLDNYFLIQKYRFDGRIRLEIHVPTEEREVMKLLLPKLTLQPIVENSVVHGLESKGDGGIIVVKIDTTQSRLLIEIRDNGVGIDPERLQQINDSLEGEIAPKPTRGRGIALNNVAKRIRLIFGEDYGVHVFSTFNQGTQILISMPKLLPGDGVADFDERLQAVEEGVFAREK